MVVESGPDDEADDSEFSNTPDTIEGSHAIIAEEMPHLLQDVIEVTKDVDEDVTKAIEIQSNISKDGK